MKPETALVKRVANPARYGVVKTDNGFIKQVIEKPVEAGSNLVNIGVYAFTREVFDFMGAELDIPDILNHMIAGGCRLNALETEGTWLDVVYPPWDTLGLNYAILDHIETSQYQLPASPKRSRSILVPVSLMISSQDLIACMGEHLTSARIIQRNLDNLSSRMFP
jgi:dTDP-glucose pyrophosphorylase